MGKKLVVACVFAALAAVSPLIHAQNKTAKDVVADVERSMGVRGLKSIQYSASGYTAPFGQSCIPGNPWPKFALTSYTRLFDYETPAAEERLWWTQFEGEECGGAYIPLKGEFKQNIFVSGDYAWNRGTNAHPLLTFQDETFAATFRQMQIVMSPAGWVKAAMTANPTMESKTVDGKRMTVISFTWKSKYKVNGYVNDQNLLEKTETWLPQPIVGDMLEEAIFSDYRDYAGVRFPAKIVRKQGGFPVLDLTITDVRPNAPVNIVVPDTARTPQHPPVVTSRQLGVGVWVMTGGFQCAVVEFKDYVAVVEGAVDEARSLAIIGELRRLVPNKPIRYVINTHSHMDHLGGLRTYVAEGATIITHEMNKSYVEEILKLPHTLMPDRLAKNPKPPTFISVKDKHVLTDGTQSVEVHAVPGNRHAADMMVVYIPNGGKALVVSDQSNPPDFIPLRRDAIPVAVGLIGAKQFILDHIQRLKLNVHQFIPMHDSREVPFGEWQKAADIEREALARFGEVYLR